MATIADATLDTDPAPAPSIRRLAYRHPLSRRVNHWVNMVVVIMLLMTGLQIFNAHPALYWGLFGSEHDTPILMMTGDNGHGMLHIGRHVFNTTGVFGWSGGGERGFPAWATIPSDQNLAVGRNWHLFLAWALILNGLAYYLFGLWNRHLRTDILPNASDLAPRNLAHDIAEHAQLRFPKGRDSNRYHILQKLAYASLLFVFLPGMIVTGLSLSPGADAVLPGIVDLLGGRQSARTLHFVFMTLTVGFIVVHVLAVLLAGVVNQMRSMITGWWAFDDDGVDPVPAAPSTLARRIAR